MPLKRAMAASSVCGIAFLAVVATPVPAQQPIENPVGARPQTVSQYRERVEVRLGTVDISVTHKDGGPITDLARGDFVLLVDGKEREITHFAYYGPTKADARPSQPTGTPESPGIPATTPAPVETLSRQPLTLVILVDNDNTTVFNRNHLLKRVNAFVRGHLVPPDTATVFVNQKRLRMVCPPTSDPERVVNAVEQLFKMSTGSPPAIALINMAEERVRDIWESRGAGTYDQIMMVARSTASELRAALKPTVNTIKTLIQSLSGIPGRKAVLYVSDGLPMNPGIELYELVQEYFGRSSIREVSMATTDASPLYEEISEFALAANVTFYAIDARGLVVPGGFEAERRTSHSSQFSLLNIYNYQQGLAYLAARTGGKAILNTNDFTAGLETIAAQLESYYSFGYPLEPSESDIKHRIEVRIRREGKYQIRYQPAFVQRTLATRVADRVATGLVFDVDDNPLGVKVEAGPPSATANKTWIVSLTISVPVTKLALTPEEGGSAATVSVFYQAASGEGRRSPIAQNRHVVEIPTAQLEHVKTVTISTEAEIGAGEHRISVGVLDETGGQAGYAVARVNANTD